MKFHAGTSLTFLYSLSYVDVVLTSGALLLVFREQSSVLASAVLFRLLQGTSLVNCYFMLRFIDISECCNQCPSNLKMTQPVSVQRLPFQKLYCNSKRTFKYSPGNCYMPQTTNWPNGTLGHHRKPCWKKKGSAQTPYPSFLSVLLRTLSLISKMQKTWPGLHRYYRGEGGIRQRSKTDDLWFYNSLSYCSESQKLMASGNLTLLLFCG